MATDDGKAQQAVPPPVPYPAFAGSGYPAPPGYAPASAAPFPEEPAFPAESALRPGVIPLRPLTLTEIFNAAVNYVRANPKATLGLTAIVVIAAQVLSLCLQVVPLAMTGDLAALRGEMASEGAMMASSLSQFVGVIATALSVILLSGMLTVIVGRAVFGANITIGEAWTKVRGRLPALFGLTALELLGAVLVVAVVAVVLVGLSAVNSAAAILLGFPLVIGLIAVFVYLWTMLSFAPVLIVLERMPVIPAIKRSFALVRGAFWRVLGIRVLAALVAYFVAAAVAVPFTVGGQILLFVSESAALTLVGVAAGAVGGAIGEIITAPFGAGVVVLLYTDRRIRAEAFDLVLQSGARSQPGQPADATDHLWLIRH